MAENNLPPFSMRLFARGSEAASFVLERDGNQYFCPLCGRGFGTDALDSSVAADRRLTREDVPPKAHPGQSKVLMLTCWPCNNQAGYTVDAEMSRRERYHEFLDAATLRTREFSGEAHLILGEMKANVWIEIEDGRPQVTIPSNRNSPEVLARAKELKAQIEEKGGELKVSMIHPVHSRRAKISDLRSAYLLCFATFGYSWAFQPALNIVRQQIHSYEDELIDTEYFWHWRGWEEDPNVRLIGEVTEPVRLLYVRLGRHSITLPGIGAEEGFYTELGKHFSPGDNRKAEGLLYPWPLTLIAQLDFSIGENKGKIPSAREKVWPGEQPG